jgi:hypothetical protein
MEGRWTIRVCACTVASVKDRGPALPAPCERERLIREVAVVPCDDAAVERGAAAVRRVSLMFARDGIDRELALAVLRAAGESDSDPSKCGSSQHAGTEAVGPTNPKPEGGEA